MITVKYGRKTGSSEATNVAELLQDEDLRVFLGYGENVEVIRAGGILSNEDTLFEGDTVIIQAKANSKA